MFKRLKSSVLLMVLVTVVALFFTASMGMSKRVVKVSNETYESLKIFSDVLSLVEQSYPEVQKPKDLIYSSIKGMIHKLDPHSSFLTPDEYKEMKIDTKGVFGGIGIQISIKENVLTVIAPIEDTPAYRAGILANDKIVKIGDKSTRDMTLDDAVRLMRGRKGTDVTIHIMRKGFEKPKPFTITRAIIKVKSVKFKPLENDIGYVRLSQFQEKTSAELQKALKKLSGKNKRLKGLVLDLRNNPGGLLQEAVNVSDFFLDSGVIVSTKGRNDEQTMIFNADKTKTQPDYPMIVLVNGGSASASEIVAGALQDHKRAVILGTTTFGKGSVQTIIPLADGSALRLTTARYYTPSGRSIQARGIEPDIVVEKGSREHLKEKDLTGHLEAEKGPKKSKGSKKITIVEEKVKGEDGEDLQLKRAVDYLKSWYIFRGTTSGPDIMKKAG